VNNASDPSGDQKRRLLFITLGASTGTSAHLFSELSNFLSEDHECRGISINLPGASLLKRSLAILASNLRHIRDVVWAQVVIVHVPSALSLPLLIAARVLGRKLVIFQWDIYPTTLAGRQYVTSLPRRFAHQMERICLKLADVTVLPSEDFRAAAQARDPVIFPLWPQSTLLLQPVRAVPAADQVFHIAFAGQINELRGLRECVAHLRERSRDRLVLHIFSSDPVGNMPQDDGMLHIEQYGRLPREELQARLRQMHFGLVSLNPRLDQPGFPSKTFDYLVAGLPVLYFGKPLPAFTGDLEKFGVGVDITASDHIEFGTLYRNMIERLEEGRRDYLAHTRLDRERLKPLL